jgi:O-methyltransferase involved in polyketide biosynthesis
VDLVGVQKTLSPVLKAKALDNRLPAPILGDSYAEQVMRSLDPHYDKGRFGTSQLGLAAVVRARAHDEWARSFLGDHRDAVVLHQGCGLDARVYRIDPPATVDCYDLDYPPVIELRRQFLPPREHCILIPSSVTDLTWLERIPRGRPVLVIAEGLVPYLTETDARRLLTSVVDAFPTGQIQLDTSVGLGLALLELGPPWAQVQRPVPLRLRRPSDAGRLAPTARIRRRGADERLASVAGQGTRDHTPRVSPDEPPAGLHTVQPHRAVPVLTHRRRRSTAVATRRTARVEPGGSRR